MSKLSESAQQAIQNGKLEETEKLVIKILAEGKIPTPKQVARPSLISAFRFVLKECGWISHDTEDESQNLSDSEEERNYSGAPTVKTNFHQKKRWRAIIVGIQRQKSVHYVMKCSQLKKL